MADFPIPNGFYDHDPLKGTFSEAELQGLYAIWLAITDGSGGTAPSVVGLKDALNARINPAKEEKQLPNNHDVNVTNFPASQVVQTNLEDDISDQTNSLVNAIEGNSISPVTVYEKRIPPSATLPSGTTPTINAVLNTEANVLDSGWYHVERFPAGQFLNFEANVACKVYLLNASDASGANMVGDSFPFLTPAPNDATPFAAPYFDKYSRIVIVNDSGSTCTELSILAKGLYVNQPAIYTRLDQPIVDQFPASVIQSIIKAKDDITGVYEAPSSHKSNVTTSLSTHIGNRTSSTGGRTEVRYQGIGLSVSGQLATWATGKRFFCTGYRLTATNLSVASAGVIRIRQNGITGELVIPVRIEEGASGGGGGISKVINVRGTDENDPLRFQDSIYIEIASGTITMDIVMDGYLEND